MTERPVQALPSLSLSLSYSFPECTRRLLAAEAWCRVRARLAPALHPPFRPSHCCWTIPWGLFTYSACVRSYYRVMMYCARWSRWRVLLYKADLYVAAVAYLVCYVVVYAGGSLETVDKTLYLYLIMTSLTYRPASPSSLPHPFPPLCPLLPSLPRLNLGAPKLLQKSTLAECTGSGAIPC